MTPKAIIFDFFDVIHRDPFNHWLKQNGLARSGAFEKSSELVDLGEISETEFYRQLGEASGQPAASVAASFAETLIDNEMLTLLEKLGRKYQIGLLSNASIEYLWKIIKLHNIEKLFDVITVSAEVRLAKPDPKIFEHVLDKLDVSAAEAIFIDDNPKNVAAAETLGITSIIFTGAPALETELQKLGLVY